VGYKGSLDCSLIFYKRKQNSAIANFPQGKTKGGTTSFIPPHGQGGLKAVELLKKNNKETE